MTIGKHGHWFAAFTIPPYDEYHLNNVSDRSKGLSNIHVEFATTTLREQKSTWAENKLNAVVKNAKIDKRLLPSKEVVNRSEKLLYALLEKTIKPKFINPSFEGGIIIEFEKDETYYMAELDNEGDIVFLIRNNNGVQAFDLTPDNYLDQIIDHI